MTDTATCSWKLLAADAATWRRGKGSSQRKSWNLNRSCWVLKSRWRYANLITVGIYKYDERWLMSVLYSSGTVLFWLFLSLNSWNHRPYNKLCRPKLFAHVAENESQYCVRTEIYWCQIIYIVSFLLYSFIFATVYRWIMFKFQKEEISFKKKLKNVPM